MVQSNYTVSTAHQLLGRMPAVRVSGSKAKPSGATPASPFTLGAEHVKATDRPIRGPAPIKPLPPTPVNTVRVRASRSSDVLAITDNVKIRADIPAVVVEDEVLMLPATIYTPATPRAKEEPATLAPTVYTTARVPVLEAPRKGRDSPALEKRISQYYEYITPPVSLAIAGSTGSRRERKASHTPTSSAGSDIYFSPIDATRSQVFLSSPQPSPPVSPSETTDLKQDVDVPQERVDEDIVEKTASLAMEPVSAKQQEMVEIAGIGRIIDNRKVTLTLAHVDRITTALARSPLVQMRVRGSHLDDLPKNMTSTSSSGNVPPENATNRTTPPTLLLPTSPPSESSTTISTSTLDSHGGIALLNPLIPSCPITHTSTEAFTPGTCTSLSLPYGLSTTSALRIEPAPAPNAESKILLQTLVAALDRKTDAREAVLLAETDVTTSFARAALTELASAQKLTLDDLDILTPLARKEYSPDSADGSIDWCTIGQEHPDSSSAFTTMTSPVTDDLLETIAAFASKDKFSAETCTMQTLTLLSELARLQTAHTTFLVLQPTRYDAQGGLAGVKIPLISTALRRRFERMSSSSTSSSSSSSSSNKPATSNAGSDTTSNSTSTVNHGGVQGRQFREAVIAAVAPRFVCGEEFETFVGFVEGKGRVRVRCVPMFGCGVDAAAADQIGVERWVCFLGGEGALLTY